MSQQGLKVEPAGILRVLKYLWGIPAIRTAVGWALEKSITLVIKKIADGIPDRLKNRQARQGKGILVKQERSIKKTSENKTGNVQLQ